METPDGRLTHFSTFSGVGGLDLGLERAGWHTVAFSEIDPYACAVLAERWPGVRNLGDIVDLDRRGLLQPGGDGRGDGDGDGSDRERPGREGRDDPSDWQHARLWSGGFPCQDLSVAGKRAGMGLGHDGADTAATRSGLAFAFLDLVERHRPECVLLENVFGLLSSHRGKDFGALLGRLGNLGYGWAYRVLDAQWAGVPQRRRRVFILALDLERHPDPDSAGKVLAVGAGCGRDHPAERAARAGAAGGAAGGADIVGALDGTFGHHGGANSAQSAFQGHYRVTGPIRAGGQRLTRQELDDIPSLIVGAPPDPDGVRAADGLAGRLDDQRVVAGIAQNQRGEVRRLGGVRADEVTPTLNAFDVGDTRATTLVAPTQNANLSGGWRYDPDQAEGLVLGGPGDDDPLLPPGLDPHRYRVIGNGVASPVAEWIGRRLAAHLRGELA